MKSEIQIMGSETSENYPHEQMVDREEVLNLIDQLEEPRKVIIPQFVADAFEKARGDNVYAEQLITAMYESSDEVGYWLEVPSNEKLLLRAWLDGYEEKEKLYYIELIKDSRYVVQASDGAIWFSHTTRKERLHGDKVMFTQREIATIDPRFWTFALEVEE